MAGMGPPPKSPETRARRNATVSMTRLPAAGRTGDAPDWPLIPDVVMSARRDLAAAKVEHLRYDLGEGKPVEFALERAEEKLAILDRQLAEQKHLEAEVWADLWTTPQAVAWEQLADLCKNQILIDMGFSR